MFYNGSLLVGDKTAFKTGEYETLFESDMAKEEKTSFHREVESFLLSKRNPFVRSSPSRHVAMN